MELKQIIRVDGFFRLLLLIVPYGIETKFCAARLVSANVLLIVPYGIETL